MGGQVGILGVKTAEFADGFGVTAQLAREADEFFHRLIAGEAEGGGEAREFVALREEEGIEVVGGHGQKWRRQNFSRMLSSWASSKTAASPVCSQSILTFPGS